MAKSKASTGPMTYEEASKAYESLKKVSTDAHRKVQGFVLKHKVKKDEEDKLDKKLQKELKELRSAYKAAKAETVAAEEVMKALKPASTRNAKYDYPADITTADEKKKYRAKMRAEAKKADSGEKSSKKEKASKKEDKAPVEKSEKKGKKEEKPAGKSEKKAKKSAAKNED